MRANPCCVRQQAARYVSFLNRKGALQIMIFHGPSRPSCLLLCFVELFVGLEQAYSDPSPSLCDGDPRNPYKIHYDCRGDKEGPCSMFESARALHRSWLAALTLSARSSPTSGVAPSSELSNSGTPPDFNRRSSSSVGTSFSGHETVRSGSDSRRGMTESGQAESWVRAWLSMPVWPFSEGSRGGEEAVKDTGGYWGLAGERRTAGSYELWRIPPTECAWQGRPISSG